MGNRKIVIGSKNTSQVVQRPVLVRSCHHDTPNPYLALAQQEDDQVQRLLTAKQRKKAKDNRRDHGYTEK
jgi:hypothetical protein